MILPVARCPHCLFAILPPSLELAPRDVHRAALGSAIEMAKHLRAEHDDEETAIALERWAVHRPVGKLHPGIDYG